MEQFISYALNHEDVLIWRALGHIKNGFYIDVGANDPTEHSLTRAFYDRGWWGINIEPSPRFAAAFVTQRPRDINLAVAAGSSKDQITLLDVVDISGWSTVVPSVAEKIRQQGHAVRALAVPQRPLADICAEHVRGEIHFLKIDVEGYEQAVLEGMDFCRWQPWLLVIEATEPTSSVPRHTDWEPRLLEHGYQFVWFDGLNRYYLAAAHAELASAFRVQPNVFDNYVGWHHYKAWQELELVGARACEQQLQSNAIAQQLEEKCAALQASQRREAMARIQLAKKSSDLALHAAVLDRSEKAGASALAENARVKLELNTVHAQLEVACAERDSWYKKLLELHQRYGFVEEEKLSCEQQLDAVDTKLKAMYASRSWRMMAPVRSITGLRHASQRARLWQSLRCLLKAVLSPTHRVHSITIACDVATEVSCGLAPASASSEASLAFASHLSADANRILSDLRRMIPAT